MLQCFQHPHRKAFIFILSVSLSNISMIFPFILSSYFFLNCILWHFLPRLSFVLLFSFAPRNHHIHCHLEMAKFCVCLFCFFLGFLGKSFKISVATQLFPKMFALAMTLLKRKSQRNGIKWITFQLLTCHFYLLSIAPRSLSRSLKFGKWNDKKVSRFLAKSTNRML